MIVFFNGQYIPKEQALVPIEDRGFMLADGIYEVATTFNGMWFRLDQHLDRFERSAREIRLTLPYSRTQMVEIHNELMRRNNMTDGFVYMQVTRGVAPRTHAFPANAQPTFLAMAKPVTPLPAEWYQNGCSAITYPDMRWGRCDIKTTNLLPNAMANTAAHDAGAYEAILVRDGIAIEGSHCNFFGVKDGTVITYPRSQRILGGITREAVLEVAESLGIPVREEAILAAELDRLDEMFFTGTTAEVVPITRVDGRTVCGGEVGPISRRLLDGLRSLYR